MTFCKRVYIDSDGEVWPIESRQRPVQKISVRKLLKFLCAVGTLVGESKDLKYLLDMTEMSDSAFRRWRHCLNHDFGVKVAIERHHAHRRGASATFRLQDFGIFDEHNLLLIAAAHKNKEPIRLDDAILNLGISTDLFSRFLWRLAFGNTRETTMAELTQYLNTSAPTLSRYLRVARNVFLMDIGQGPTDTRHYAPGAYHVESWGLIDLEKLIGSKNPSKYEALMVLAMQSKKPKMVLTEAPW